MPHSTHRSLQSHRSPRLGLAAAAVVVLAVGSSATLGLGSAFADSGGGQHQGSSGHGGSGVFHVAGSQQGRSSGQGQDDHDGDKTDPDGNKTGDQTDGPLTTDPGETLPTSVRPGTSASSGSDTPTAAPLTAYEMPFPCGQSWAGTSRPNHTPSPRAVDWNATDDLGMPVVAAAGGTVTTAVTGTHLASYGQYVVIDHGNGESTLYGHLNSVLVTVGQTLTQGQQIGTLGSTGNSTGPHLHFEERLNGVDQDVWLHGALFPMNSVAVSTNCGSTTTTTTTTTVSVNQVPLAGNMYGSRAAEVMVYKLRAHAYFDISRTGKADKRVLMGNATDRPVLGDWDGDGRVNAGVRRGVDRTFFLRVHGQDRRLRFGQASDLPIAGNWDGTGGWEVGIRKAKSGVFKLRAADGSVAKVVLGDAGDTPVTGDWNGDGRTDLGVYDPATSTFTLEWVDASSATYQKVVPFGQVGDYPVAGDWNGDGTTDVGVWDPHTRTFERDGQPTLVQARTVAGRVNLRQAYTGVLAPVRIATRGGLQR